MPCERPLTHGGAPWSKWKSDSQAMPPARALARPSASSSRARSSSSRPLCWKSPLARPKVPSHWTWIPWPGVVLPDELAAGEHHALAVAQQRALRPPGAVALQGEEDERGAGGGEQARLRDRARVGDHGVELAPARAVELLQRRLGVVVGLGPRVVVELVDGAGGEQRVELGGHGARRLGVGGHRGEQDREHRREQGNRRAPHGGRCYPRALALHASRRPPRPVVSAAFRGADSS